MKEEGIFRSNIEINEFGFLKMIERDADYFFYVFLDLLRCETFLFGFFFVCLINCSFTRCFSSSGFSRSSESVRFVFRIELLFCSCHDKVFIVSYR